MAKQISVFLENSSGRLAHVTRVLGDAGINIRALSIADTSDFGILRLIVSEPNQAYRILKDAGFTVSETEVIAVRMPDSPGGLADVLDQISEESINIEYLYAFLGFAGGEALVIFKVEDINKAREVFQKKNIQYVDAQDLYKM
ncbi:MAG: ACT domain-containing protein [Syntrophomonadaceae bacterium]|nr:ACT domain-containing protein [Syntrophomonadaceae bacterium]